MRPKGFTSWREWGTGASEDVAAGPAITTLRAGATRTVAILRCLGVACVIAQVIIWHSYYLSVPWRLAGPAAAVAWGTGAIVYVSRRWPAWPVAAADSGFYMLLALCARWYIPSVLRGDTSNWLDVAIIGQLVSPAWFTPTGVMAVLALGTAVAYWAGAALTPAAVAGSATPITAAVMMVAVALAAWIGRGMLFRKAQAADADLDRADRSALEQYVLFSRYTERREQERMLHDTILNTLTALARPDGGAANVVARCKDDVALIERMLGDPDDIEGTAWSPVSSLLSAIDEVLPPELSVRVEAPDSTGPAPAVPARVVRAAAYAVREALTNVAHHAGTDEAVVAICRTDDGGLQITVRDQGNGFDPGHVDPARLGIRRSIVERVADQGGWARVESAPGEGTAVTLRW
jgi:signal transduction histidine kinase